MHRLFYLFILALVPVMSSAQVAGSIRDASDDHSSNCNTGGSSSGSDNSSGDSDGSSSDSDSWFSSDDDGDSYGSYVRTRSGSSNYRVGRGWLRFQARRLANPRLVSLEVIAPYGHNLDNYNTFTPTVRAHYGPVSWGLRASAMFEPRVEGPDDYWWTMDAELLNFNIINKRWGKLRVGTGFTVEAYSDRFFHEYNAGLDLFFHRERFVLSQEVRLATDYCGCGPQRKEYNGSLNILLMKGSGFRLYNSLNAMHQRYYGQVTLWSFGGGLRFMLY